MMRERRSFIRTGRNLPVQVEFQDSHRGTTLTAEGTTSDLGADGIGLALETRLALSPSLGKVRLGGVHANHTIELRGKLVWQKAGPQNGTSKCGLQLTDVCDEYFRGLRQVVWQKIDRIINSSIQSIAPRTTAPKSSDAVTSFFIQDTKSYLREVADLYERMKRGALDEPSAQCRISEFSDELVRRGNEVAQLLADRLAISQAKRTFRTILGPWIYQSTLMKQGFMKPRGYPGDYELLEFIYDRSTPGQPGQMSRFYDAYFIQNAYAESVRNRKDKMAALLRDRLRNKGVPARVLNLACGGCREVREILSNEPSYAGRMLLTALDQDGAALDFARQELSPHASGRAIRLIQEDILKLLKKPQEQAERLGQQDLIYSIGLADYLPDRVLRKLTTFCLGLLNKGGQFIVAHKDHSRDPLAPLPPDWFCDWNFEQRDQEDMVELVKEAGDCHIEVEREASGRIFFIIATKTK